MNIDTFCEFEQIEELEYREIYGNPAEETFFYENKEEDRVNV